MSVTDELLTPWFCSSALPRTLEEEVELLELLLLEADGAFSVGAIGILVSCVFSENKCKESG